MLSFEAHPQLLLPGEYPGRAPAPARHHRAGRRRGTPHERRPQEHFIR